jgi:hypothetical protein
VADAVDRSAATEIRAGQRGHVPVWLDFADAVPVTDSAM